MPPILISPDDIHIPAYSPSCESCKKGGAEFRCSRCHTAFYCDALCQTANWREHKKSGCVDYTTLLASNSRMFEAWTGIWGDSIMHWAAFSAGLMQRETTFLEVHAFIVEIELAKDVHQRTPASAYEALRARWITNTELTAIIAARPGGGANLQMSREVLEEVDGVPASTLRVLILSECDEMYYCDRLPGLFGPFIKLLTLSGYETHSNVLADRFQANFFDVVRSGDANASVRLMLDVARVEPDG
ncbi:hypothetical protein B0H13DRAFT_2653827 [Mycena leptocephala]|nr:hypothetical protein B0H13DRAFT_2653827 [Mycena leptocephala]